MISFLILVTFSLDCVLIRQGENWCWSLSGLKGIRLRVRMGGGVFCLNLPLWNRKIWRKKPTVSMNWPETGLCNAQLKRTKLPPFEVGSGRLSEPQREGNLAWGPRSRSSADMTNWKAAGPDLVQRYWFKKLTGIHTRLQKMPARLRLPRNCSRVDDDRKNSFDTEGSSEGQSDQQLSPYCLHMMSSFRHESWEKR